MVIGAVLARELPAELDVVLSRKLRAPFQPELAIGAIGQFYVDFEQVEDAEVVRLLREFRTVSRPQDTGAPR